MHDRLDAGLVMMAASIAGGKIPIIGVAAEDIRILIEKMMQMGIEFRVNGHVLVVSSPGRHLKPVNVITCRFSRLYSMASQRAHDFTQISSIATRQIF